MPRGGLNVNQERETRQKIGRRVSEADKAIREDPKFRDSVTTNDEHAGGALFPLEAAR